MVSDGGRQKQTLSAATAAAEPDTDKFIYVAVMMGLIGLKTGINFVKCAELLRGAVIWSLKSL